MVEEAVGLTGRMRACSEAGNFLVDVAYVLLRTMSARSWSRLLSRYFTGMHWTENSHDEGPLSEAKVQRRDGLFFGTIM